MIDDRDLLLTHWRFDGLPQARYDETFSCVAYDPDAAVWRMWVHADANTGLGYIAQYQSATGPRGPWSGRVIALDDGPGGAWDEKEVGVPFVWYEAGETRPWRMIYRGKRTSDSLCQIGLATSLNGTTWERKDTTGNALAAPVIPVGAGWDVGGIDGGGVLKVDATYYYYYNTFSGRKIGLATSTDLVAWTKHPDNPLLSGVTDYDDKDHNGTVDLTAGFFCADIVRWDKADGTVRYVWFVPHYRTGATTPDLEVYVAASPTMTKANRSYLGKAFQTDGDPAYYVEGGLVGGSGCDTPHIVTDDISRNVVTSTRTGNDVLMMLAVASAHGWNSNYLIHNRSLHGASLSNVFAELPVTGPVHRLDFAQGDANTLALWLPGATLSLYELSGGAYHLYGKHAGIDSQGVKLVASDNNLCRFDPGTGTLDRLNTLTNNLTVEARIAISEAFGVDVYQALVHYGQGSDVTTKFLLSLVGQGGGQYKLQAICTIAGVSRTALSNAFTMTPGTQYRVTFVAGALDTVPNYYFFVDGALNRGPIGWYAGTLLDTPTGFLSLGWWSLGTPRYFNGYIDEVRISNSARWTAGYTPAALTRSYQTSGTIFSPVYDFGRGGSPGVVLPTLAELAGASQYLTILGRAATGPADQSTTIGDFSATVGNWPCGRYQQFALVLATGDTAATPELSALSVEAGFQDSDRTAIETIQMRVTTGVPNAAPGGAGGLLTADGLRID